MQERTSVTATRSTASGFSVNLFRGQTMIDQLSAVLSKAVRREAIAWAETANNTRTTFHGRIVAAQAVLPLEQLTWISPLHGWHILTQVPACKTFHASWSPLAVIQQYLNCDQYSNEKMQNISHTVSSLASATTPPRAHMQRAHEYLPVKHGHCHRWRLR